MLSCLFFVFRSVLSQPHRIQTALSLYSETLAGLILLVEDRLNTYSGVMKSMRNVFVTSQSVVDFLLTNLKMLLRALDFVNLQLRAYSCNVCTQASGFASGKFYNTVGFSSLSVF